jgi:hypothetical protein
MDNPGFNYTYTAGLENGRATLEVIFLTTLGVQPQDVSIMDVAGKSKATCT